MGGLRSLHNQTGLQKTLHRGINVVSPNNSGLSGDNWIQDRPAHIDTHMSGREKVYTLF